MASRDPARKAALIVVAIAACVAAYALIASVVDTEHPRKGVTVDAGKP
jgi:hypothetical protein